MLASYQSEKTQMLDHLAKTPTEHAEYEAPLDLRKSPGHPVTGFWHEIVVNREKLWSSYGGALRPIAKNK